MWWSWDAPSLTHGHCHDHSIPRYGSGKHWTRTYIKETCSTNHITPFNWFFLFITSIHIMEFMFRIRILSCFCFINSIKFIKQRLNLFFLSYIKYYYIKIITKKYDYFGRHELCSCLSKKLFFRWCWLGAPKPGAASEPSQLSLGRSWIRNDNGSQRSFLIASLSSFEWCTRTQLIQMR